MIKIVNVGGMDVLLHTHILLSSNNKFLGNSGGGSDDVFFNHAQNILSGNSHRVVNDLLSSVKFSWSTVTDELELLELLQTGLRSSFSDDNTLLILAISLLQTFIQNNYTGPTSPLSSNDILSGFIDHAEDLNKWSICLLSILGQPAYDLCDDPIYLVLSLVIFEQITQQPTLFLLSNNLYPVEISIETSSLLAIAHWWRARALIVQLSLVPEPAGNQSLIASSIFSSANLPLAIIKDLPSNVVDELGKDLHTIYYLEAIKCSLATNTEHLCLQSLFKVKQLTNFQFVLTGARAKRTKFQQQSHSSLIILAKSSSQSSNSNIDADISPETFNLDSDILLERPYFESIGNEPLDMQIIKKQKLDVEDCGDDKLLPVAISQENIPALLKDLDPNDQPQLLDYDNIQLLLRLYVIKKTTPARNPLVEEELAALISRILYQQGNKNWTIFSRSLWERSILETNKAKTIERGLLQMQSLVEELGLKIRTKFIPQFSDDQCNSSYDRLRYIHQLPFIPRWELDVTLAEKYMSMGILRSAVEIYERLGMECEAALCYAAVGDEKQAKYILSKRIESNPKDARAYSILGDIMQDPSLWEKSWKIGRYVNAKNSLGRYYYKPPKTSGLNKNYLEALKHLNDSLKLYPLNFDTWYFYGCIGLESGKIELAAEAFSRCISLDSTHALAWSNLSAAYIEMNKLKEAYSCLKKAVGSDAQNNWRIWENYMIVSMKLNEWDDVLLACRRLVHIRKDKTGEGSIDIPVIEKLVEVLVSSDFPNDEIQRFTHYQLSCIDFVCNVLPNLITTSSRCWKIIAKVELWRKRPWAVLECHEKSYRALSHNPELEINENVWNDAVESCENLVAAYESLGELEGKHGAGDLVCKDWKYKARSTIRSLINRGKSSWEDSNGWTRLSVLREQF